ncbi:unnamed protein product, partial [Laminaria digitata]
AISIPGIIVASSTFSIVLPHLNGLFHVCCSFQCSTCSRSTPGTSFTDHYLLWLLSISSCGWSSTFFNNEHGPFSTIFSPFILCAPSPITQKERTNTEEQRGNAFHRVH